MFAFLIWEVRYVKQISIRAHSLLVNRMAISFSSLCISCTVGPLKVSPSIFTRGYFICHNGKFSDERTIRVTKSEDEVNIHFFHPDPVINARYLDDRRVIKMMTENFQMMAAALHRHGLTEYLPFNKQGKPYGNSHPFHPSTLWAGDSRSNLLWLVTYTEALYQRYKRSGGQAFVNVPSNLQRVREGALFISDVGLTKFVNCAASKSLGIDFKHIDDVFKAYEMYMTRRWEMDTIKLTWSGI